MVLMITGSTGLSLRPVFTLPIFSTTSIPCTTVPKIVCLLSSQSVGPKVMKNWEPPVFGPRLAMARTPILLKCKSLENSSGIV